MIKTATEKYKNSTLASEHYITDMTKNNAIVECTNGKLTY